MDGIKCFCGEIATGGTVRKDGPNKGKNFLRCPKWPNMGHCKFFEWTCAIALPATPAAPVLVTPQAIEPNVNPRILKLEHRVTMLEEALRRIGVLLTLSAEPK